MTLSFFGLIHTPGVDEAVFFSPVRLQSNGPPACNLLQCRQNVGSAAAQVKLFQNHT